MQAEHPHASSWILHHYPQSPVAQKIRFLLSLCDRPWWSVEIPRLPPKPLLMPLTGNYRRTPVLQIGADVYCDSQNIACALAESGCSDAVYGTQAPGRVLSFAAWVELALFALSVRVVITDALETAPPEFVKDRGDLYFGRDWSPESLRREQRAIALELHGQLAHLESMLAHRPFFGGATANLADAAVGSVVWFLQGRWSQGETCLADFPRLLTMMTALQARDRPAQGELHGEDALAIAASAQSESPAELSAWGQALGYQLGSQVSVRPAGDSSDPDVIGRLRALTDQRISLDHRDPQVGDVVVHFPLSGYRVQTL